MTSIRKHNRPTNPGRSTGRPGSVVPSSTRGESLHPGNKGNTLQPGQSVLPGSIDVPGGGFSFTSGKTPESVWWSHGEMGNTLDWIKALLNNSNNGGSLSQGYADVLGQIIKDLQNDPSANINPDMVMSLFQNLLSYQTTQDQRSYDYMMLNESRQYNNPTNELARYMGAGISRDAALQMLSGNGAGGSGGYGGSTPAMQSPAAGAGAAALNSSNAHQNLVNNIYNGIQMVASLVSQGVGVAQSIEQTRGLQMQNFFSQEQMQAYQSVNQVAQFLHNATMQGIIEPATMDSWHNANDVFKWLLDNKDNEAIAPLIQSGAVGRAFGSQLGRQMFNNHWQQQNRSRTDGEILEQYIRSLELQNDIAALQPMVIGAEMTNLTYQNLALDAQSLSFYQNMQESAARIRLMNKQGELLKWEAKSAELNYQYNEAGFPMMKQNRIDQLTMQAKYFEVMLNKNGDQVVHTQQGDMSPFDAEVMKWLQEGTNAFDMAYLKHLYNDAVGTFAQDHPGLYKLCTIFDKFGIFRFVADAAIDQSQFMTKTNLGIMQNGTKAILGQ